MKTEKHLSENGKYVGDKLNHDLIVDIEIEGIDMRDYPDFCDAFVATAYWSHTGEELTEDECHELQENYPELIYEEVINHIF